MTTNITIFHVGAKRRANVAQYRWGLMRWTLSSLLGLMVAGSCSSPPPVPDGGGDASDEPDTSASSVLAVPLSVCNQELAYAVSVTIGTTQTFPLLFDTGSTTLGVAGSGCTSCNVTPLYMPGSSATDTLATANVQYAIGTWSGEIYEDNVALAPGPSTSMRFVSISAQNGFLRPTMVCGTGPFEGVIGFARAPEASPNTDAFFDELVASAGLPDVFATELCDGGGTLWLGGFDPSATTAAPVYTPFKKSLIGEYYDSVDLQTIAVSGTNASATIGTTMYDDTVLDSGTSALVLPSAAVTTLTAAIAGTSAFQQVFGADAGAAFLEHTNECLDVMQTKAELDAMLPSLALTFGTGAAAITVQALPTESYLYTRGGSWCSAFYPLDPTPTLPFASILGSPIMRSNVLVFDRMSGQLGLAPHAACPM
jgi:hypothetical protein